MNISIRLGSGQLGYQSESRATLTIAVTSKRSFLQCFATDRAYKGEMRVDRSMKEQAHPSANLI